MPLDTHKQGYGPSSWACLPKWKGLIYFVPPPMRGTSRVQSQELLVIAPAILKCVALGSITLWKEKKSIFRALKAFLFFCGVRGVGKGRCVDVTGIFNCSELFFSLCFAFSL